METIDHLRNEIEKRQDALKQCVFCRFSLPLDTKMILFQ